MLSVDPEFRKVRRESLFLIVPWLVCCGWSVTFCYLFGYSQHPRSAGTVSAWLPDLSRFDRSDGPAIDPLGWGMPSWAFWGLFVPWIASILFSIVYALGVMTDSGDDPLPPAGKEG